MKLEFIHNFSFDIDNGSKAVLKKQNPKKKKKKKKKRLVYGGGLRNIQARMN